MSSHPTLLDISTEAYTHQSEVDEIRQRFNITHHYFDCWIYGFLENKNFKLEEAVEKLQRRNAFEKDVIANYNMTDWIMESMQKGTIQIIGNDKQGRVAFYVVTARDKPTSAKREEMKVNFDMMVSYGTRLRADNKRCQMAMLINQDKASLWSNMDMTLQADIALRIAKFYPGCVDKMYICNMNRTLAAMAKPIFSRLPSVVSDRIIIISDGDKKSGKLLEYFDESVLPVALGGTNECDHPDTYSRFAVTIKEHFEQMRAAILRGLSVKEWELECLFPEGLPEEQSFAHRASSFSAPSANLTLREQHVDPNGKKFWSDPEVSNNDENSEDLLTCETVDMNEMITSPHLNQSRSSGMRRSPFRVSPSFIKRDIITECFDQFALLENFLRQSIEGEGEREWLSIVQRSTSARHALLDAAQNFEGNKWLFEFVPFSLQVVARGLFWLSLLLSALYFLLATFFVALIGCFCATFLFFSMFSQPYNVFQFGCAFLVSSCQVALLCSRGIELARGTYEGKVVSALAEMPYVGFGIQAFFSLGLLIATFTIFCVMATRYDVITGIQYSLAFGWIVATCVVGLYHFFYAFDFFGLQSRSHRSFEDLGTLYFFLDIDMESEQKRSGYIDHSQLIIVVVLFAASIGLGVGFMVTEHLTFLAFSVVVTFVFALSTSLFVNMSSATSASGLMMCATLYTSVAWLDIVFTTGSHDWYPPWGTSAGVLLLFTLLTDGIVIFYALLPIRNTVCRRWLYRGAWLWIIMHVLACIILMFLRGYRLGLFTLALGVHLLLHVARTGSSASAWGVLLILCSFLLVVLACILIGHANVKHIYTHPVSLELLPTYATTIPGNPLSPLCTARFSGVLDIVGMALFAKLGDAGSLFALQTDLQRWFPGFTLTKTFTFTRDSFLSTNVFTHETADGNRTSIITFGPTPHLYPSIDATTMWIDVAATSFFAVVTPPRWLRGLLPVISVLETMSTLLWHSTLLESFGEVDAYAASALVGPRHAVYVVGYGLGGATAALFSLLSPHNVSAVSFASPVNGVVWHRGGLTGELAKGNVLSVLASSAPLPPWWMGGGITETVPCPRGDGTCYDINPIIHTLNDMCQRPPFSV